MTVRDNVHQLVDLLPENRLEDLLDYLEDLGDSDGAGPETEAAIEEGMEDIRRGRTVSLQEYRRSQRP